MVTNSIACLVMFFLKSLIFVPRSFIAAFITPLCCISYIGWIADLRRRYRLLSYSSSNVQASAESPASEWTKPFMIPYIALISGFSAFICSISCIYMTSWDSTLKLSKPYFSWSRPTRFQIAPLTEAEGFLSLISSNNAVKRSFGLITSSISLAGYVSINLISNCRLASLTRELASLTKDKRQVSLIY